MTPEEFFKAYMTAILERPDRHDLWLGPAEHWTDLTKSAARTAIEGYGFRAGGAQLLVDVTGLQDVGDQDRNFHLRVAFEHENSGWYGPTNRPFWYDEIVKLTHVYADLRILASYHNPRHSPDSLEMILQHRIDDMERCEHRMSRIPGGKWLFIFGPNRCSEVDQPFRAYTLKPGGTELQPIGEMQLFNWPNHPLANG